MALGAIHSHHHRLYCPYAFGALYNHPVEGFLMDTIGAGMSFKISGMTQRGGLFFFIFSTLKTVDDHCGYKLPWDPLQWLFWNNAEYHDIHHQSWGIKVRYNPDTGMKYPKLIYSLTDQFLPTFLYMLGPLA